MLDPDTDSQADTCTVIVDNAGVADNDGDDPPDNMAADFTFSFTTPGAAPRIYQIQAPTHVSPYDGQLVSGVPGRDHGRAAEQPLHPGCDRGREPGDVGRDPRLPHGIGAGVSAGQAVLVSGRVTEFRPGGATSANLSTTEIVNPAVTPAALVQRSPRRSSARAAAGRPRR